MYHYGYDFVYVISETPYIFISQDLCCKAHFSSFLLHYTKSCNYNYNNYTVTCCYSGSQLSFQS